MWLISVVAAVVSPFILLPHILVYAFCTLPLRGTLFVLSAAGVEYTPELFRLLAEFALYLYQYTTIAVIFGVVAGVVNAGIFYAVSELFSWLGALLTLDTGPLLQTTGLSHVLERVSGIVHGQPRGPPQDNPKAEPPRRTDPQQSHGTRTRTRASAAAQAPLQPDPLDPETVALPPLDTTSTTQTNPHRDVPGAQRRQRHRGGGRTAGRGAQDPDNRPQLPPSPSPSPSPPASSPPLSQQSKVPPSSRTSFSIAEPK